MTALGLYIHIPFCTRRCDYCDFFVAVGRSEDHARFAEALEAEIRAASSWLDPEERAADTVYLGGGTPSVLPTARIRALVAACRDAFDVSRDAEITLEANPEGITPASLEGWLAAGVNRLSVGIQTLDDEALRRRGRLHSGPAALRALVMAREAGFVNVGADLIAGLPEGAGRPAGFPDRFAETVRTVLSRRPDHLSVYLLETDKDTSLMRAVREGREALPEDDDVAAAYHLTAAAAAAAGYEHYEISSFCLPGRRSRHNLKYWTGDPYLGFGPSAHSYFRSRRFSSPRDLDAYLAGAGGGPERDPGLDYTLRDRESEAREALVLNLRLTEGVDLDRFARRWGIDPREWVRRDIADVMEAGLVRLEGSLLRLTPQGLVLANELFWRLAPHS